MRLAWLACCVVGVVPIAHAQELSFQDAVTRAEDGPSVIARREAARGAQLAVRPAGQLPDPQLVLGLQNVPVEGPDAYRLDRDFMTMQSIGIMQDMPSGAERRARRAIAEAEAGRTEADLDLARLEARLGAARAWIAAYYAGRRVEVLVGLAREARASAEAARGRLAAGGGSVNEAIAAEIEAARMEDRGADAAAALIAARAELRRWIGEAASDPLAAEEPQFTVDAEHLRAHLRRHPALLAFQAEALAADAELRMARAERIPDWSWTAMYQRRDDAFGDMASVEVRIGLPLFQAWRQGPLVEARRADQRRVAAERASAEREHLAALQSSLADYAATQANLVRARDTRLPLARQRADAAAGAFASGAMSTDTVIAARRDALEAELDVIALSERRAMLGAALTLQYAETAP
ncbi:MAG: TolC family protein [Hyphomonadaceae bacterium]|nr:TolC family protein [Hyphomonadaceae bacterium]